MIDRESIGASGSLQYLTYTIDGSSVTITDCDMDVSRIDIPSKIEGYPVTRIEKDAFAYSSLTSIVLPKSLITIGDSAFFGCKKLASIILPDSVTTIGNKAFADCNKLTTVTMSNSLVSIGDHAFKNCYRLASIIIPNSVTDIGERDSLIEAKLLHAMKAHSPISVTEFGIMIDAKR
jgi:hypothetical protein